MDCPVFSFLHWSLLYFGLQQYSKTHGCYEGLPIMVPIHNVDLLCALSYLIWLTQCASALLSASKESVLSLSSGWRDNLGSADSERKRQRANHCLPTCHKDQTWLLFASKFWKYICEQTGVEACIYLSHLSVTVMYGCIFLPLLLNEWQDVLIVCFCLVCVLSVFSISVSLIPCTLLFCLLKHRPHCCSHRGKAFADLFCLYCRRQRERETERERACWKGEKAAIVIVLFGSAQAPLVWEEEKDVLCFVYDRVAKAATGNLWACRQAFSGCSAASQPLRSSLLQSITHCSRNRTNHAATTHNLLPYFLVTSNKEQQIQQSREEERKEMWLWWSMVSSALFYCFIKSE